MIHTKEGQYQAFYLNGNGQEFAAGTPLTQDEVEASVKRRAENPQAYVTKFHFYRLVPVEVVIEQVVTIKEIK